MSGKKKSNDGIPNLGQAQKEVKPLTDAQIRGALNHLQQGLTQVVQGLMEMERNERTINVKVSLDGLPALLRAIKGKK